MEGREGHVPECPCHEEDIKATVRAAEFGFMDKVDMKETVSRVKPVHSKLGPAFKRDAKAIAEKLSGLPVETLTDLEKGIALDMGDGRTVELKPEFYEVERRMSSDRGELESVAVGGLTVLMYK